MEYLSSMAAATVVLGFIWGIFSVAILRPLNNAIVELRGTVKELRDDLRDAEERRHRLEVQIAEVNQSVRAAHHRIDGLEGMETPKWRE